MVRLALQIPTHTVCVFSTSFRSFPRSSYGFLFALNLGRHRRRSLPIPFVLIMFILRILAALFFALMIVLCGLVALGQKGLGVL